MAGRKLGYGHKVHVGGSNSELAGAGSALGWLRDINWDEATRDEVEITELNTTGSYREFMPVMPNMGAINFEVMYASTDSAIYNLLVDYYSGLTMRDLRRVGVAVAPSTHRVGLGIDITGVSGYDFWLFFGSITEIGQQIPRDDMITCQFKLKIGYDPTAVFPYIIPANQGSGGVALPTTEL